MAFYSLLLFLEWGQDLGPTHTEYPPHKVANPALLLLLINHGKARICRWDFSWHQVSPTH